MHLVGLKNTVRHLNVAGNSRITDESTTCMIKLFVLDFVILQGTSISMVGLRRLASAFKERLSISPPSPCIKYLKRIPLPLCQVFLSKHCFQVFSKRRLMPASTST